MRHLKSPCHQRGLGGPASVVPPCHVRSHGKTVLPKPQLLCSTPLASIHAQTSPAVECRSRAAVRLQAVASPASSEAAATASTSLKAGSIVQGVVQSINPDGAATIQLAPDVVGTLASITKLGKAKGAAHLSVGDTVAAMVEQSSPLQLSSTRLEIYPGELVTNRAGLLSRAAAFLEWSRQRPGRDLAYPSWLGAHLLTRITEGLEPLPFPSGGAPNKLPAWADVRLNMLVRGVVQSVVGDTAFINVPSHRIKSRGILHISQFSRSQTSFYEFAEILQPGTQIALVVQKIEAGPVAGLPSKFYFSCRPLEPQDGSIKDGLDAYNVGAAAVHTQILQAQVEKRMEWINSQLAYMEEAKAVPAQGSSSLIEGAVLLGKVQSVLPFGVTVQVEDGSTHLLHISKVSSARITSEQLAKLLPEGTEVAVRVQLQEDAPKGKGVTRLGISTTYWEHVPGDWLRKREAVLARSLAMHKEQKQKEQQQKEKQPEQQLLQQGQQQQQGPGMSAAGESVPATGEESQGQGAGAPRGSKRLLSAMQDLDSLHLATLMSATTKSNSNELPEAYTQVVERLEARVRAVVGGPLPWDTNTSTNPTTTTTTTPSSPASPVAPNNSNESNGNPTDSDANIHGTGQAARQPNAWLSVCGADETAVPQHAVDAWTTCAPTHRPLLAMQLSLRIKAHALRAMQAGRLGNGSAFLTEHESGAVSDGLALAALTLLPAPYDQHGTPDCPAALLATVLTGLADASWLLGKADAVRKGKDAGTSGQATAIQQWLHVAAPMLAVWCTHAGPDVLLTSHVLPTLQHTGWLAKLKQTRPEAWHQLTDHCFKALRRRLLTSRPITPASPPLAPQTSARGSNTRSPKARADGPAKAEAKVVSAHEQVLTHALALFQLAEVVGYLPRAQWWAAALGQVGDEAPQIWQSPNAMSRADAALVRRFKGAVMRLTSRGESQRQQQPKQSSE